MIINRKPIEVEETYTIREDDTLRIETKGRITNIFINSKEINFVTKIELNQSVDEYAKLKIKRMFVQEDYEKLRTFFEEAKIICGY